MSATTTITKLVTIGESGPTQQQITAALSSSATQDEFDLAAILEPTDELVREIRAADPDIILIDHKLGAESFLDVIDDLGDQLPDIAIVAIIPSDDPIIAQQVMLAGARAFLIHPFTQVNLLSVLRRVRDVERRRGRRFAETSLGAASDLQELKILAVYSPRGGTGCTTIATNLAISIHEESSQRVLLVGGKLFFGHLGVVLNIRTNNTIADLIPHSNNLDEALVNDVVFRHASGIHVLLDPFDIQIAQGIRPQDLYSIMNGIQSFFDTIIVDIGTTLNDNTVTIMDMADRILVVTTPDLASLHDTTRFTQITKSLAYPQEKLQFILNRTDMEGAVRTKDVLPVVNKGYFSIPEGGPNVIRSINRGIPLILRYPRNPTSRALKKLAQQIVQQQKSGATAVPSDGMV